MCAASEASFVVSARRIIERSTRLDLISKYLLATAWIEGLPKHSWFTEQYLSVVAVLNGYHEDQPRKKSQRDFVESFFQLVWNMSQNGYTQSGDVPLLDSQMNPLNAAHRIAAAAALDLDISVEPSNQDCPNWGAEYFRKGGLQETTLFSLAKAFLSVSQDAHLVLVQSVVSTSADREIIGALNSSAGLRVYFRADAHLSWQELRVLKLLNYAHHDYGQAWARTDASSHESLRVHTDESFGANPTRLFVVVGDSDALVSVKQTLRMELGFGNRSVHSCDSKAEAMNVFEFALNPASRQLLMTNPAIILDGLTADLNPLKRRQAPVKIVRPMVVTGSKVMEVAGLRGARDIDLLVYPGSEGHIPAGFSSHLTEARYYSTDLTNLIYAPQTLAEFDGVQFLALKELLAFKRRRAEVPKDLDDVQHLLKAWNVDSTLRGRLRGSLTSYVNGSRSRYRIWRRRVVLQLERNRCARNFLQVLRTAVRKGH